MKSRIEVIKELIKKYPNDYQLGSAVRRFLTEDYWVQKKGVKTYENKWLEQLDKI
tara:strand:- start:83 stop:247 length:165 start_codon:yes stop_codon:yes gene_type:complete